MLKDIILCSDLEKKFSMFYELYNNFDKLDFNQDNIEIFKEPSYAKICKIVPPKYVLKRGFSTDEKRAIFLHSLLHIEYSAIDLALDSCYRFNNMPKEFYKDFLDIANDEIRHFKLIENLLKKLGYKYGDFPVHNSLFEAAMKSLTLLERMAVIPRWYEANGLDANEKMISKISHYKDNFAKETIDVLKIILKEEIPHVKKGDFWFKYECDRLHLDYKNTYFSIIDKFFKNWKKDYINVADRLKSGFSCDEIEILSKNNIECKG